MPVDDRLRSALRDQADGFVPQVEESLDRVRARGRRERWRTSAVVVAAPVAAAAAVAAAVLAVDAPRQEDLLPLDRPTTSVTDSATDAPTAPLRGTVIGDVERPEALAGRWSLQLNGNGSIDVSPPAGFGGDLTGLAFTADGTSFRTSLFENGLCGKHGTGIYSWLRVVDRIDFETVSDTCAARTQFFANTVWAASTGTAAGD